MRVENEEAGSVAALAGPVYAEAARPADPCSSTEQLTPEGTHNAETQLDDGSETTNPGIERLYAREVGAGGPDESASDPIDGADVLHRARALLGRFVQLPSEAASVAAVLWAAHAHLMDAWDTTPRLALLSAEPGSGKTRAMEITALLVPRALVSANASAASLIRALNGPEGRPTFFIDEIDAKYGPAAKGDEDLRSMINAGYRRGGYFLRCEMAGDKWIPVKLDAYAAIAMAGIGDLPDTILTRSVIIRMRKRAPDQKVDSYRQRDHEHLGHALRDELAVWAEAIADKAAAHIGRSCPTGLPTETRMSGSR